jgi:transposase-like protein
LRERTLSGITTKRIKLRIRTTEYTENTEFFRVFRVFRGLSRKVVELQQVEKDWIMEIKQAIGRVVERRSLSEVEM